MSRFDDRGARLVTGEPLVPHPPLRRELTRRAEPGSPVRCYALAAPSSGLWPSARDLVRKRYAEAFGANTSSSPDWFLVACEAPSRVEAQRVLSGGPADDTVVDACIGVSMAAHRRLFCESYLPAAAESVVSDHLGEPVGRDEVFEFGPFAASRSGAGSEVLDVLPMFGWLLGARYGLMTVTTPIAAMLRHKHYPFEPLADAHVEQLPTEQRERWGTYYDQRPRTCLIQLRNLAGVLAESAGRYHTDAAALLRAEHRQEGTRALV